MFIFSIYSLSCPCLWDKTYRSHCKVPENCPVGLTKDACGCCDVCAKAKGEACGGPWFLLGRCGKGLKCIRENPEYSHSNGICQPEI